MPYKNGNKVWNETIWTKAMLKYLTANFHTSTNQQLADRLKLRLTVTRNKCSELGLKRMEMEYWSPEQVKYLKENYRLKGDVELAEIFEKRWPKKKRWVKQHICKKRKYLNLKRTAAEIHTIASKNSSAGGKSFTIDKNSSSKNMHPRWVAQMFAKGDTEMQMELIKDPEAIEAMKGILLMKREIKKINKQNGTNKI